MMTALGRRIALTAAMLVLAAAASAQEAPSADRPRPLRWDIVGSVGLIAGSSRDLDSDTEWTYQSLVFAFDAGRYWTPHLKTEIGVVLASPQDALETPPAESPDEFGLVVHTLQRPSASAAAAWQFGENAFAHPYVSGGLRVGWRRDQGFGTATADGPQTSLIARPFVAAGFKSYFNRRLFMRTEALMAFGPGVFSHAIFRVGFGRDFQ